MLVEVEVEVVGGGVDGVDFLGVGGGCGLREGRGG